MDKKFWVYQNEFFDLYLAGKVAEALELVDEIESNYPNKASKTKYWKACIYSLKNKKKWR